MAGLAILGALAALARRAWRHLKAFLALFALPGKLRELDARVHIVEQGVSEQAEALRTEMKSALEAQARAAAKQLDDVRTEVRSITSTMARADDQRRIEGKLDQLLLNRFNGSN